MARINVEERWWSDPRRTELILKIGYEADTAALNLWRLAQEFWAKEKMLVPIEVFERMRHASILVEVGLAVVRERSVYVRGSSDLLGWLSERRSQAQEAGRKSAEARRKKAGSAQPKGGKGYKKTERDPNEIRTEVNGTEPSCSYSYSYSSSNSKSRIKEKGALPISQSAPENENPVSVYCAEWKSRNGKSPDLRGKEIGQLRQLGKDLGPPRACQIIRTYFRMPDSFFIKRGYDVSTMLSNLAAIQQFEANGKVITSQVVKQVEEQVDKIQGTRKRRSIEELEDERRQMLADAEGGINGDHKVSAEIAN